MPDVTTRSIGIRASTTTERSTSPRSILWNASSTASRPIVSLTNCSSGSRPWRWRSMSIGKSRLGRQSPYQLGLSRPPRPKKSIIGSSMRISGFGHADLHDGAGEVAGVERLLEHLRVADRLDAHVGAVAVGERLDRLDRDRSLDASTVWVAPNSLASSSFRASRSTAMIVAAPASRAPAMAASPTPPQPNTATESPRPTSPVSMAAPRPAITPQPSSPATSGFTSADTLVHWPAATSVFSAKAPMPSAGDSGDAVEGHLLRGVEGGEAVPGPAPAARPALAAHRPPVEDHEVAGRDVGDVGPDGLDHARPPRGRAGTGTRR